MNCALCQTFKSIYFVKIEISAFVFTWLIFKLSSIQDQNLFSEFGICIGGCSCFYFSRHQYFLHESAHLLMQYVKVATTVQPEVTLRQLTNQILPRHMQVTLTLHVNTFRSRYNFFQHAHS